MGEHRTEVCVVGGGPAGIAAATVAAEHGKRTSIIDDGPAYGGQIWRGPPPRRALEWIDRARRAGVEHHATSSVVHAPDTDRLLVSSERGMTEFRTDALILCTGARERLLPFPGWTLPNVMGVGGLQALVKGGLRIRDKRVVLAGSGPLLLAVASDLVQRGAQVVALVEQAPRSRVLGLGARAIGSGSRLAQTLGLAKDVARLRRLYRAWPTKATGRGRIGRVTICEGTRTHDIECDYLACGFGLVPEATLARLLGCRIDGDRVVVDEHQATSCANVYCAGEPTGIGGVEAALLEGQVAGHAAAHAEPPTGLMRKRDDQRRWTAVLERTFALDPALRELAAPDTIVCRCEDVTMSQLRAFSDPRHAKLQTRCGMGPCQGRVCGPALSFCLGLGSGRPRPPISPIPLSQLATDPETRGPTRSNDNAF